MSFPLILPEGVQKECPVLFSFRESQLWHSWVLTTLRDCGSIWLPDSANLWILRPQASAKCRLAVQVWRRLEVFQRDCGRRVRLITCDWFLWYIRPCVVSARRRASSCMSNCKLQATSLAAAAERLSTITRDVGLYISFSKKNSSSLNWIRVRV